MNSRVAKFPIAAKNFATSRETRLSALPKRMAGGQKFLIGRPFDPTAPAIFPTGTKNYFTGEMNRFTGEITCISGEMSCFSEGRSSTIDYMSANIKH
jgi:hypothetical protein